MLWCGSESIFWHCDSFKAGLLLPPADGCSGWDSDNSHRVSSVASPALGPLQKDVLFALLPWPFLFWGTSRRGWSPESGLAVSHSPSAALLCIHCSKNREIGGACASKGFTLSFNSCSICVSCPPALLPWVLELGCSASPNYSMDSVGNRIKHVVARLSWLRCDLQT